jgi:hypothetical protein
MPASAAPFMPVVIDLNRMPLRALAPLREPFFAVDSFRSFLPLVAKLRLGNEGNIMTFAPWCLCESPFLRLIPSDSLR